MRHKSDELLCFLRAEVFNSPERKLPQQHEHKQWSLSNVGSLVCLHTRDTGEENSPLAGRGVALLKDEPALGRYALGAERRIMLSRSGSNLLHGDALSVGCFHLNG